MWVTGSSVAFRWRAGGGFTLLELLLAMTIAALVLAVAVPATARMYDGMRYREAVREVISLLSTARYQAITRGEAQNVEILPRERRLRLGDKVWQLPADFDISVSSAKELNRNDVGVIRFYPEGGSSGGGLNIVSPRGGGLRIRVDWLMGGVTQESYAGQ